MDLTTALGVLSRAFPESLDLGQSSRRASPSCLLNLSACQTAGKNPSLCPAVEYSVLKHDYRLESSSSNHTKLTYIFEWIKLFLILRAHSWKPGDHDIKEGILWIRCRVFLTLKYHATNVVDLAPKSMRRSNHKGTVVNVPTRLSSPLGWKLNLKASQVK